MWCIVVIDAIAKMDVFGARTWFTYPFYVACEFFTLSVMMMYALNLSKRWHIAAGSISVILFIESAVLWMNGRYYDPGIGKIASHIIFIASIAYILIENLKKSEPNSPFLTVYIALFVYYAVSLFMFLILDKLTASNVNIWLINNLFTSMLYSSSAYAFYKLGKVGLSALPRRR